MSGELFSDPEINTHIRAEVLRLQASSLEWGASGTNANLDDHILHVLVDSLDVHAAAYLCKVDSDELIPRYVSYMRDVGSTLIHNVENRGPLQDPYREDALRKMAESTGDFIARKHSLTADEQEAEIWRSLTSIRVKTMTEAESWQAWKLQLLLRIETRLEARYRHWEANAIERVRVRKGGWLRRLQHEMYETESHRWPTAMLPVRPFTQTGGRNFAPAHEQPATLPQSDAKTGLKAQTWEDIEISFLSDERVQITSGGRTETRNYGELGFMDKRAGKPNQGWGVLRALARAGGSIPNSARNSGDFVAMGKRIERMRKTLMEHFGIPSDPVLLDSVTGYCCRFKIGCAPSFGK